MEPALVVALLWLAFGGTHVGLAVGPVRKALVGRLGERGFFAAYCAIAAVTFGALVAYWAAHRDEGAAGLGLAALPAARAALLAVALLGVTLAVVGLVRYPALPMALFGQPIREARGIERISRHPLFAGLGVFALAHVLLAASLASAVFFAGVFALAAFGAWHQDRKHLARRGQAYADYLAHTSAVPFSAIVRGRQHLVWRELPHLALAGSLLAAVGLRAVHGSILDHDGLWVIVAILGGAAVASLGAARRARRAAARVHERPADGAR